MRAPSDGSVVAIGRSVISLYSGLSHRKVVGALEGLSVEGYMLYLRLTLMNKPKPSWWNMLLFITLVFQSGVATVQKTIL